MLRFILALFCFASLFPAGLLQAARTPVMVEGKSSLPLRVLTRPMSSLYRAADESAVVQGNLPIFTNFYVYTKPAGGQARPGPGWYEVGTDDKGTVVGWVKADDVFEWKQTMCLTYTNPSGRSPVLMFENRQPLEQFIRQPSAERAAGVKKLYDTIDSRTIPAGFPVISVEPKLAVDISKQFYLLPILNFQAVEIDNRPSRLLELAAVTVRGEDSREPIKVDDPRNWETVERGLEKKGEDLTVDIVWVIDTTLSMGPFINQTTEMVKKISREIVTANPEFDKRLRFGVWGFRDSVEEVPGLEYLTRNFTPDLKPIEGFLAAMGGVKETRVDSVGFPEDVFAGVQDGLYNTAWRPNSLKIMILVGDAPGHQLGQKRNSTRKNPEALRIELSEKNITFFSIQIRSQAGRAYHALAQEQFTTLARNKGGGTAAYFDVNSDDMESFNWATNEIVVSTVKLLSDALAKATGGGASSWTDRGINHQPLPIDMKEVKEDKFKIAIQSSLQAALVDWLGSATETQAPRDVVAWVIDKDLLEPSRESLEVRLLISKRQFDSLRTLLARVIEAAKLATISGDDFFTAVKAASATVVRDPDRLSQADSVEKSGLVPEFLEGLPYQSRLTSMSNELWKALSPDEQDNFINAIEANVKAYQSLHDAPGGWIALNEGDDADEMVYPLPLELLP